MIEPYLFCHFIPYAALIASADGQIKDSFLAGYYTIIIAGKSNIPFEKTPL